MGISYKEKVQKGANLAKWYFEHGTPSYGLAIWKAARRCHLDQRHIAQELSRRGNAVRKAKTRAKLAKVQLSFNFGK